VVKLVDTADLKSAQKFNEIKLLVHFYFRTINSYPQLVSYKFLSHAEMIFTGFYISGDADAQPKVTH